MTHSIEIDGEAWARACRLIETLARNIGGIAPGSHASLYADLNEHGLLAESIDRKAREADRAEEPRRMAIDVTDEMLSKAMRRVNTFKRTPMKRIMLEIANEYDASGDTLTPDALVEVAVARFLAKREAWLAQGGLRGEAWKKANPNWRG